MRLTLENGISGRETRLFIAKKGSHLGKSWDQQEEIWDSEGLMLGSEKVLQVFRTVAGFCFT